MGLPVCEDGPGRLGVRRGGPGVLRSRLREGAPFGAQARIGSFHSSASRRATNGCVPAVPCAPGDALRKGTSSRSAPAAITPQSSRTPRVTVSRGLRGEPGLADPINAQIRGAEGRPRQSRLGWGRAAGLEGEDGADGARKTQALPSYHGEDGAEDLPNPPAGLVSPPPPVVWQPVCHFGRGIDGASRSCNPLRDNALRRRRLRPACRHRGPIRQAPAAPANAPSRARRAHECGQVQSRDTARWRAARLTVAAHVDSKGTPLPTPRTATEYVWWTTASTSGRSRRPRRTRR